MRFYILYSLHHVARIFDLIAYCILGSLPIMLTYAIQLEQVRMLSSEWSALFGVWMFLISYLYFRVHFSSKKFEYNYPSYSRA